jgi:hypothetical protein
MDSLQGGVGIGALSQRDDAGYNIVVVDQPAIFPANGSGELAEPDFRALRNSGNIPDMKRRPVLGQNDSVFDIGYIDPIVAPSRVNRSNVSAVEDAAQKITAGTSPIMLLNRTMSQLECED